MKSILISGCSTGIGRATALHFSNKGYRVYAGVRREVDADSLRQEDMAGNIEPVILDVTVNEQLEAVKSKLEAELSDSGLTALVNNAGVGKGAPLEHASLDDVRTTFEVNTIGPLILTQAFIPLVRKAKGRIVTVGSVAGKVSGPVNGAYCMSKHAIEAFSDSLRAELAPQGIKVSLVEPGPIATPMLQGVDDIVEELRESLPAEALELYGDQINGVAKYFAGMNERALPPEEVAAVIEHAVEASNPKIRYLVTTDAKFGAFMRWLLPDWGFDALMRSQMK
jgi:NAD(P)-dependent dehydrogenase (short-subunit alcohol dehydrogenase family)